MRFHLVLCTQVIWYHHSEPVKESKDFQLVFEGDRCSLVIREVYLEDSGQYKCTARNVHGNAESSCMITVERKSAKIGLARYCKIDFFNRFFLISIIIDY